MDAQPPLDGLPDDKADRVTPPGDDLSAPKPEKIGKTDARAASDSLQEDDLLSPSRSADPDGPQKMQGPGQKRVIIAAILLTLLGVGLWQGYIWWTVGRFVEHTDDAYVRADIITYSAQVAGRVVAVPVADNSPVKKGDILVRIDDTSYRARVDQAAAGLAASEAGLGTLKEQILLQHKKVDSAKADLDAARSQLRFAKASAKRGLTLFERGSGTKVAVEQYDLALDAARANEQKAEAALALANGQFSLLQSQMQQQQAAIAQAAAALAIARDDLSHVVIRAGYDGVVGNRGIDVGEYVQRGSKLLSLVPLQDVYVEANFKETQVQHFREGMAVSISADMLGGQDLHGHLDSLSPATGSEFALLQPQNATGNFTKIVQRIPVKILIDLPETLDGPSLRPGTSVVVKVDTRQSED